MPFTLADIVPWGRSYDEYRLMFGLDAADLAGRIVGCADGPARFNADATRRNVTEFVWHHPNKKTAHCPMCKKR